MTFFYGERIFMTGLSFIEIGCKSFLKVGFFGYSKKKKIFNPKIVIQKFAAFIKENVHFLSLQL